MRRSKDLPHQVWCNSSGIALDSRILVRKSAGYYKKEKTRFFNVPAEEETEVHLGQLKRFSLRELQGVTDNFSNKNILGRGGFGKVFEVFNCLRERTESQSPVDWPIRRRNHTWAANLILEEEFEAVIRDFGLAKLMDNKDTHVTTAVHGTIGHISLEAFDLARLANDDDVILLNWVKGLLMKKKLQSLVDANMQDNYVVEQMEELIQVALLCTQDSPTERPKMSEVHDTIIVRTARLSLGTMSAEDLLFPGGESPSGASAVGSLDARERNLVHQKGDGDWRYASVKFEKVELDTPTFLTGEKFSSDNAIDFVNFYPRHARLQNMMYYFKMKVEVHLQVYTQKMVWSDKFKIVKEQYVDKAVCREIPIGTFLVMVNPDLCWMEKAKMHEFCLSGIYEKFDPSRTRVLCKITHQSCKNLVSPVIVDLETKSTSTLIEPSVVDNDNVLVQVTNDQVDSDPIVFGENFCFDDQGVEFFGNDDYSLDEVWLTELLNSVPEDEDTTIVGKRKLKQESFCGTKKLCLG
ncbi:hypothetical protein POM88_051377 [Heracleum sosnowskyi]|uniref:Uncharacterized protein n=1 Tax=Heracleum sosnowskyi TaxID=360622 RepID=A0AAD8H253_9APIA|nr:hypothetical protein POM88_051377 [Heracleum sosnowskyi]